MFASANTVEPKATAANAPPRLIAVGPDLADYFRDRFGVEIAAKTLKGLCTRDPALQAVYFLGRPYTTGLWADAWLFARLRDAPPRGSARARPPSTAQLRALFAREEAEIRADMERADLTERERGGDIWSDTPPD